MTPSNAWQRIRCVCVCKRSSQCCSDSRNRQPTCLLLGGGQGCIMSASLLGKKRKLLHLSLFFLFNLHLFQGLLSQKKSPLHQAITHLPLFLLFHLVRSSLINTTLVLLFLAIDKDLSHLPIAYDDDDRMAL